MSDSRDTRLSPLDSCHREWQGRMVDFAGWRLPVQYTGVVEEHLAVRSSAGLFDVSHMGEIRVRGAGAEEFVQALTPNDVSRLAPGQVQYTALLTDEGTYLDDLLVYRLAEGDLLLVVNAANTAANLEHIESHSRPGVSIEDESDRLALLALQGPHAARILEPLTATDVGAIGAFRCLETEVAGVPLVLSRTGYTGEDGFELYVDSERAPDLWRELLGAGEKHGLVPAGLGARDSLRLEAGLVLYGHEIDRTTTPWEAGLGWTVKLGSGPFVGREALKRLKKAGPRRRLAGVGLLGRGPVPRQGYPLFESADEPGEELGRVTSGTWSPTLDKGIGMVYLPVDGMEPGRELVMEVRGRKIPVAVISLPFYRRRA